MRTHAATSPRGALHNALAVAQDPIAFLAGLAKEQGDHARAKVAWRDVHVLTHPDLVHEMLVTKQESFVKGHGMTQMKTIIGENVLSGEGKLHAEERRVLMPAFHPRKLAPQAQVIVACAEELADSWQESDIDVGHAMMRLGQRVVARTQLGVDLKGSYAEEISWALSIVERDFKLLMLPFSHSLVNLRVPGLRRLYRARRILRDFVDRAIATGQADPEGADTLSVLRSTLQSESRLDRNRLRDNALAVFMAGHDTTANALTWTWLHLALNPEVDERWRQELDTVLAGRTPTAEDVPRLRYTRQVFAESMRLHPPVWTIGREALVDVELGGQLVPRAANVQACQWLIHRDARFHVEPLRFWPERWDADARHKPVRGSYFPFGMGKRSCIGEALAWTAGTLTLATVGQRWRLRLGDRRAPGVLARMTVAPDPALVMSLERR